MRVPVSLFVISVLGWLALAAPAMAQHTCSAGTSAQFQSCLNAAGGAWANEDSVITLSAGTYSVSDNGGMPFTYVIEPDCNSGAQASSLTITGNGVGSTILDGADTNQVLHIRHKNFDRTCYDPPGTEIANDNDDSGATITVEAVTVQNGRLVQVPERRLSSSGCNFDDGSESAGGMALKVSEAEIMVADSEFLNNRGNEGGGVKIGKSCGSTGINVADSRFEGNGTIEAPALDYWVDLDTCEAFASDPGGNSEQRTLNSIRPDSGGGAKISARDGMVVLERNVFANNQTNEDLFGATGTNYGADGGGLSGKGIFGLGEPGASNTPSCPNSDSPWAVEVDYDTDWASDFVENESGGVDTILVGGSVWSITDNRFENNTSNYGDGGGAHLWGNMTVERNEFINNQSVIRDGTDCCASGDGGGLHIFTRDAFELPILTRNLFQGNGSDGEGGGLQLRAPHGRVDVTASIFAGNSSDGHVRATSEQHVSQGGGGGAFLYTDDGTLNFVNNSACGNSTTAGQIGDRPRAVGNGGGVVVYAQLSDDASGTGSGGPYDLPAVANIYNNVIWGNTADGDGGDLFIEDLHAGSNQNYNFGTDPISDSEGSEVNLFNNNFGDLAHLCEDDSNCTADLSAGDNTSLDPEFANLNECRFFPTSPMATAVGFPNAPGIPPTDFDGNPIDSDNPILGAVLALADLLFRDRFEG